MRVAYMLADPGIGVFGTKGASVHVQEIIRALRAHGHEVTVFCTKRGNKAGRPETESVPADLADLQVVTVPVRAAKDAAEREIEVTRVAAQMAELAAADPRGFGLVYERYSLFSDAGARVAEEISAPLVVEVNAPLVEEQRDHRTLHDAGTAWRLTDRTLRAADVVCCVSDPVASWVREVAAEVSPNIAVIPNGVNIERIQPSSRPADAPFTIGFVGTLKPWHGTDQLVRAFAAAAAPGRADWRLEFCGDGPELENLQRLASELGVADQVHFHGAVAPAEIPGVLAGFDVAVAPYPAPAHGAEHYFSPLKVYEYLAAGLCVVASAVGELPEVLGDGEHGLLVPPGDIAAMANAFDQLASHPEMRRRMAMAGRACVVQHHSWTRRCATLLRRAGLEDSIDPHLAGDMPPRYLSAELTGVIGR